MSDIHVEVPIIVISEHTLVREGIKTLLAGSRYRIRHNFNTIGDAIASPRKDAELVFIGAALDVEMIEPLKALRAAYPGGRTVLYTQMVQVAPSVLLDLFGSSLDGCLSWDTCGQAILQSIDLIMMGEPVLPLSLLFAASRLQINHDGAPGAADHTFSKREREILLHLCEGSSNKTIARALQLSEATVKIHLKTLFGKIGVPNRTQAAIWATTNRRQWDQTATRQNGAEAELVGGASAGPE